tara:strand:+ start:255 stop:758 length:504 start_codon:yes stop_codon:yes gene_type:complete
MVTKFNKFETSNLEKKFYEHISGALVNDGFGIYDLRFLSGSSTLRVFIIKSGEVKGIDINDCVKVDRLIGPLIETESWVPDNIVLEVSSPGLYRDIRSSDQLKYSIGELIKIRFNSSLEDKSLKNKHFVCTLIEFGEEEMTVIPEDDTNKLIIKYETVKSVNAETKI